VNEEEMKLLRMGVTRCSGCEIIKRKLKCPRYDPKSFCAYEIEKLKKTEDFEGLQQEIVISFGELLVLLAERSKIRAAFGQASVKELKEVSAMINKWITGTRQRQKMSFQKRDFSKALTGDEDDESE